MRAHGLTETYVPMRWRVRRWVHWNRVVLPFSISASWDCGRSPAVLCFNVRIECLFWTADFERSRP